MNTSGKKCITVFMMIALCGSLSMQGAETQASIWNDLAQGASTLMQKFNNKPRLVRGGVYIGAGLAISALASIALQKTLISRDDCKDHVDLFCDIAKRPSTYWFAGKRIAQAGSHIDVHNLTQPEKEKLTQLKDTLYDTFALVRGKKYGALVCLDEQDCYRGTFACERALVITGGRVIAIEESPKWLQTAYENDVQREVFELLYKLERIKQHDNVTYRPEGERNYLNLMMSRVAGIGDGWFGYFLGYDPRDIEFYYQRAVLGYDLPAVYARFSAEEKQAFEVFKRDVWPTSLEGVIFETDKICMDRWLAKQASYSNADLMDNLNTLRGIDDSKFGDRGDRAMKKELFKKRLDSASEEERNAIIQAVVENKEAGFVSICLASNKVNPDLMINGKALFDWCAEIEVDDYAPLLRVCFKRNLVKRLHERLNDCGDHEVAALILRLLVVDEQKSFAYSSID